MFRMSAAEDVYFGLSWSWRSLILNVQINPIRFVLARIRSMLPFDVIVTHYET